jgi:hypothetical protein
MVIARAIQRVVFAGNDHPAIIPAKAGIQQVLTIEKM